MLLMTDNAIALELFRQWPMRGDEVRDNTLLRTLRWLQKLHQLHQLKLNTEPREPQH